MGRGYTIHINPVVFDLYQLVCMVYPSPHESHSPNIQHPNNTACDLDLYTSSFNVNVLHLVWRGWASQKRPSVSWRPSFSQKVKSHNVLSLMIDGNWGNQKPGLPWSCCEKLRAVECCYPWSELEKGLLTEDRATTLSDMICENLNHMWIDIFNSDEDSGENNRGMAEKREGN